ncbi:MAG: tRNA (guanosine(37)-N1)-methyltransferase TrmD [Planctomycetota bacterium]
MPLRIDIVTLFPEMFGPVLETSIPGRAVSKGAVEYHLTDIRPFGKTGYKKVDDRPAGGGPGMVMMPDVLAAAVDHAEALDPRPARRILTSPRGVPLTQDLVKQFAAESRLLFIAGHYEGIDERFAEEYRPLEVSLGDYVLSGGELAVMVMVDAVIRLLPGVLGHADGAADESFEDGLLEHPQYTKPAEWRGRAVPDVLRSGDHGRIAAWRAEQRRKVTGERRPDLL